MRGTNKSKMFFSSSCSVIAYLKWAPVHNFSMNNVCHMNFFGMYVFALEMQINNQRLETFFSVFPIKVL